MATNKQPKLFSASQRLEVEQYVYCFERATLILFFIWFFALIDHKTVSLTIACAVISICFLVIILYLIAQSELEVSDDINSRPGIIKAATVRCADDDEYEQFTSEMDRKIPTTAEIYLFWLERLAISSFFILFIQVETSAVAIGAAAATAGLLFCCNLMYFLCFWESDQSEDQQQGIGKVNEDYEMKLKIMKDKWEKELKKIRDQYREDCRKWEEDNRNLTAKLLTATATSELYRALLRDRDSYL